MFFDFVCCELLYGLVAFINWIFHVMCQFCDCPYLTSSCVVVSVPCSTLTVAEVAVSRGVATVDKWVDVGVTGVVQELDNPGSVFTT